MKYEDIKFFSERCEEHPDHQSGMITNSMIQQRLHEEIDELREYIEKALKKKKKPLNDDVLKPGGPRWQSCSERADVCGKVREGVMHRIRVR